MSIVTIRFAILAASAALAVAQQQMPKTTSETVKGTPTVTTEQLHGTVVYVEGNDLVVRMSDGDIREFKVPPSRKFIVDGKEMTVRQLKQGTELTATITTTTTPVTERTKTVGTGKVWWVSGNTVIITLPNNENRTYKVLDSYRFNIDGKPASVHDLRKGMMISAEKIVEEPRTEIASDTVVTGKAPPAPAPTPAPERAAAPEPKAAPQPAPAPPPQRAQATPPPAPAPIPAAPPPASEPAPSSLPQTGSIVPLIGLVGLSLITASLGMRMSLRRQK